MPWHIRLFWLLSTSNIMRPFSFRVIYSHISHDIDSLTIVVLLPRTVIQFETTSVTHIHVVRTHARTFTYKQTLKTDRSDDMRKMRKKIITERSKHNSTWRRHCVKCWNDFEKKKKNGEKKLNEFHGTKMLLVYCVMCMISCCSAHHHAYFVFERMVGIIRHTRKNVK